MIYNNPTSPKNLAILAGSAFMLTYLSISSDTLFSKGMFAGQATVLLVLYILYIIFFTKIEGEIDQMTGEVLEKLIKKDFENHKVIRELEQEIKDLKEKSALAISEYTSKIPKMTEKRLKNRYGKENN